MASQKSHLELEERHHLTGKVCVVTGSSRGIGRGIAEELGQYGANVVVNYRSSEAHAYDVVDEIEAAGGTAVPLQADVTERDQVEAIRDRIHDAFGPIDVLVNNAGVTADTKFEHMSYEDWDRVIDVNLTGVFNCTKAFFDDLKHATQGRLINISSVIGKRGNYGQANYAAAKSGLFGFTRSLARELAPHGTTANCVAPGYTRTDMVASVPEDVQDELRNQIPLGRFASIDEIACVVRFLTGDESTYVTGSVIDVSGGMGR